MSIIYKHADYASFSNPIFRIIAPLLNLKSIKNQWLRAIIWGDSANNITAIHLHLTDILCSLKSHGTNKQKKGDVK